MTHVDLSFGIQGDTIPRDHSYSLLSAISRIVPEVHSNEQIGILPVAGLPLKGGKTRISKNSKLVVRLPSTLIPLLLPIAGKSLDLDGDKIRLGIPQVFMLKPKSSLYSRMVTIKGFLEEGPFEKAVERKLNEANIQALIKLGPRKVVHIKDKTIVGFTLALRELNAEDSITIQERGIGGRRRMGCGIFLPARQG